MDIPSFKDELIKDIYRSHRELGSSELQSNVLMRCIKFLLLEYTENELNLFSDETLQPIAGHALIMFSFPGKTNQTVEDRIARSISSSKANARGFYQCLAELKYRFIVLRNIPVAQVNQFISIINKWIATRLKARVAQGLDDILAYECLQNATLLREDQSIAEATIAYYSKSDSDPVKELVPGAIVFSISETPSVNELGIKLIQSSVSSKVDPQTADEFHHQLYRIQDPKHFSAIFAKRFWHMCSLMLKLLDTEALQLLAKPQDLEPQSQFTQLRLYPLARVLLNNILAQMSETYPDLLRVLATLLTSFKLDFWTLADGLHYRNFVDSILQSQVYSQLLRDAAGSNNINDLVSWVFLIPESVGPSQKQAAAVALCDYFIRQDVKCVDYPKILLSSFNSETLSACRDDPLMFLRLSDASKLVSRHANTIVTAMQKSDLNMSQSVLELIAASLTYDVMFTAHNSSQIQRKEVPTLLDVNMALWDTLLKVPLFLEQVISSLLRSFSDVVSIIIFKERKNEKPDKELEAATKMHNRDAQKVCKGITTLLEKIALADPDMMLRIMKNASSLMAIWNCIFSPETNQAALDILYQVFDAEGRYEAICGLLNLSLQTNLASIVDSFTIITKLRAFEPCPKAVRILMDVIKALADPLDGILTTNTTLAKDCGSIIQQLWASSWLLLVMIYQLTLVWATMYHLGDLIEFTRDVLDVSHLLLDAFRPILEFLDDPEAKVPLFGKFLKAFNHVIVWLRLGDTSLLKSCVELVFKGFDLAKEMGISVDKEFLTTFVKYGAKAKKFNNKLTEQQREDVLAKASTFDKDLVEAVVEEARQQRLLVKEQAAAQVKPASQTASYAYQSAKPKQSKQLLLTRFGVVSKEPPVAPPPPKAFKSNNLEAIRNELKNNRAPQKPVGPPAPPRPAGFNSKRAPVVGRSLNTLRHKNQDSDSSSSDEDDIDTSDLFLESKKKSKIIELDINGNPVTKVAQANRVNQERREEERMRMRLNVNLKPLYSTILRWNYNLDSPYPTEERDIYQPVKDLYTDVKEYVKVTEPLLMLECWQGIQSSRTTGQELPVTLLVGSRTTCDGFFDVYASIKKTELMDSKINESDLMVLGYLDDPSSGPGNKAVSAYLKKPGTQTCLAKVRHIKHANSDYCDITLRVYPQGSMMGLLTPKTSIVGMKVMQMTTVEREYSSLKGLPYYDLCNKILTGTPSDCAEIKDDEARSLVKHYNVNLSQAKAILGSSRTEGFSLIQGPPGTGKTKTILGIVGHFLSTVRLEKSTKIAPPSNTASRSGTPEEKSKGPKVLICAPSNAAVDELVVRVRDGIFNSAGDPMNPKIVRLGRSDAINQAVRDLSLEELIDRQLSVKTKLVQIDPTIRSEHTKCIEERNKIREELKRGDLEDEKIIELETKLREINKKRSELGKRLDDQRENASIASRTRDIERRQAQAKILSEAQIICSTLSGSAHDFLATMSMKFDQVIIDEACQCVELSAIIPLRYGCKRCIMVGDPNQLPPTVLSQTAASFKYEESLFVRMQRQHPESVYLLDVQYRMHPDISAFPSAQFYNSRLTDGSGMFEKNDRPWHKEFPYTPYRFFDILSRHQQSGQSKSFFNYAEAKVALELVQKLMEILPNDKFKGRVGIISPYKEQIRTLRDIFIKTFGSSILSEIDFNTVDGFQGQEKEIIIMSCVRASETGSVGFLSDVRRMNVALTRARTTLWILGNKSSLRRDKVWRKLIDNAESRGCVTLAEPGFSKRPMRPTPIPAPSGSGHSETIPKKRHHEEPHTDNSPQPSTDSDATRSDSSSNSKSDPPPKRKPTSVFADGQGHRERAGLPNKPKSSKGVYIHPGPQQRADNSNSKKELISTSSSDASDALTKSSKENQDVLSNKVSAPQEPPKATNSGVYMRPPGTGPNASRKKANDIFIRRPNQRKPQFHTKPS